MRKIPMTLADVPPGSVLRNKNGKPPGWLQIVGTGQDGLTVIQEIGPGLAASRSATFDNRGLMENHEISRDGGKTWHPCYHLAGKKNGKMR